jgi:serine protease Do
MYQNESGRRGMVRLPAIVLFFLLFLCGGLAGVLFVVLTGRTGWGPAGSGRTTTVAERDVGGAEPGVRSTGDPGDGHAEITPDKIADARLLAADELEAGRRNAIVRAAQKAAPAVVTVGVTQVRLVARPRSVDPFWGRYLPPIVSPEPFYSIGSGVIVDPAGVILTNAHVVEDATELKVTLPDGRNLPARVVGYDPNYDLAVIKVDGGDLPTAEVGDSDELVVGEWAIAIGNPFGFSYEDRQPTVTVGVISALHRDVKGDGQEQAIYKDMIQTDAAINPGNSGGALVNALGQVVGINTFILTPSGGSIGIGFAIPAKTAVQVARDIIKYGQPRPIWIGITLTPIAPLVAQQLGLSTNRGLLVQSIDAGSPAERAGMELGDFIVEIDGRTVLNNEQAGRAVFGVQPEETVRFSVLRQGRRLEISVRVTARPGESPVSEPQ